MWARAASISWRTSHTRPARWSTSRWCSGRWARACRASYAATGQSSGSIPRATRSGSPRPSSLTASTQQASSESQRRSYRAVNCAVPYGVRSAVDYITKLSLGARVSWPTALSPGLPHRFHACVREDHCPASRAAALRWDRCVSAAERGQQTGVAATILPQTL